MKLQWRLLLALCAVGTLAVSAGYFSAKALAWEEFTWGFIPIAQGTWTCQNVSIGAITRGSETRPDGRRCMTMWIFTCTGGTAHRGFNKAALFRGQV